MTIEFDELVDARGLTCPEPVMMLHAAIRDLDEGQSVKVIATDPSTCRDIPNFCEFLNHQLEQMNEDQASAHFEFIVRKGKK